MRLLLVRAGTSPCSCCAQIDRSGEVYTPRRERWCTDVICLLLLITTWGGMGTLGYFCAVVKPQLLWKLYYPTDSYGQFCGRPGTAAAVHMRDACLQHAC